jgi:prolyl-tRNA synthetase
MVSKLQHDLEKAGIRTIVDKREEETPGWKFNEWELRGVPIQMMVGQEEVKEKMVTIGRRDEQKKWKVELPLVVEEVKETLEKIQQTLYSRAEELL